MSRVQPLTTYIQQGRLSWRARRARLREKAWQIGQCAAAAGLAWLVAEDLFDHTLPYFAPTAAVLALGTSYGQRLRRVVEVAAGVAVGVVLGDLLVAAVGRDWWQIGLAVAVAMTAALLLGTGQMLVTQAAVQSIAVVTLLPSSGVALDRWTDALIGGGIAVVAASVVPAAPLRKPRVQAGVVLSKVARLLQVGAYCLEDGDADRAGRLLAEARSTDVLIRELEAAADEGLAVVTVSPFRRGYRGEVQAVSEIVEPLVRALTNTRVLVRRVTVAAYREETVPESYVDLVRSLGRVAEAMADELLAGHPADPRLEQLLEVGRRTAQVGRAPDLSAQALLAQARSITVDLLQMCGLDVFEATDAVPMAFQDEPGA